MLCWSMGKLVYVESCQMLMGREWCSLHGVLSSLGCSVWLCLVV